MDMTLTEEQKRERRCRKALALPPLQDELDENLATQRKEIRDLDRQLMRAGCLPDELEEVTDGMGAEDYTGILRRYKKALAELLGLPTAAEPAVPPAPAPVQQQVITEAQVDKMIERLKS